MIIYKRFSQFITCIKIIFLLFSLLACSSSEVIAINDFEIIDEENKPNEIWVTTLDFSKYHFSKPDYYIKNDTLYGNKKYMLNDTERFLIRKIAVRDIISIQTGMNTNYTHLVFAGLALTIVVVGYFMIL